MTNTLSMSRICDMVEAQGVPCTFEHTGGGVATIYAGWTRTDEYGDTRYDVSAGPGWFETVNSVGVAMATADEFYIGRDEDGGDISWVCPADADEAAVAAAIVAEVLADTDA